MKKYHFVYITTNLVNGKKYVGDHSTDDLNSWRSKNYLGSGKLILKKIKEYGKENFQRKILEFYDTKQEANSAQEKYIKIFKSHVSENGYNISVKGGHQTLNSISEETREKMRNSKIGKKRKQFSEEHKKKIGMAASATNSGRVHRLESKKNMSIAKIGKLISEETRLKRIGKLKSATHKENISKSLKGNKNALGYKHSNEAKEKISISVKNRYNL